MANDTLWANNNLILQIAKQVTRGTNIDADGWAGAFNPYPYPMPHPTPSIHTHTSFFKNFCKLLFVTHFMHKNPLHNLHFIWSRQKPRYIRVRWRGVQLFTNILSLFID